MSYLERGCERDSEPSDDLMLPRELELILAI